MPTTEMEKRVVLVTGALVLSMRDYRPMQDVVLGIVRDTRGPVEFRVGWQSGADEWAAYYARAFAKQLKVRDLSVVVMKPPFVDVAERAAKAATEVRELQLGSDMPNGADLVAEWASEAVRGSHEVHLFTHHGKETAGRVGAVAVLARSVRTPVHVHMLHRL